MPSDCIMIDALQFDTIIGCLDWERHTPQPVCLDLKIYAHLQQAGQSDDLVDTLNYAQICEIAQQTIQHLQAKLVEHAGLKVIEQLFAWDHRIEKIALTLKKTAVLPQTQSVGIYLERCRDDFGTCTCQ